jgi:Bacterial archaeo-eukaryotic release factor family 11
MLYVDIPTTSEFRALAEWRADACVSIYVPTTPLTQGTDASRIELRNLSREAARQLRETNFDKKRASALEQQVEELVEDYEFWKYQSSSLAVFATPDEVRTYRLPNSLTSRVDVSDRFHLAPVVRTLSFPYSAFVLAVSQGSVRLVEISETTVSGEVAVPNLPHDLSDATRRTMPRDRGAAGRLQGSEGQKTLIRQFARQVDRALRGYLAGQTQPLILAGVDYVLVIYRSVNSYPHLLQEELVGNFDHASAGALAESARAVLTRAYEKQVRELQDRFLNFQTQRRTSGDLEEIARSATHGAVDTLLINIEHYVYGYVNESGSISVCERPSAVNYDIVSEIAIRVLLAGGRLIGVRTNDMPGGGAAKAILRYPLGEN